MLYYIAYEPSPRLGTLRPGLRVPAFQDIQRKGADRRGDALPAGRKEDRFPAFCQQEGKAL